MDNDFIIYSGNVTSVRKNVDGKYIWFDIGKMEVYTDKDGNVKTNPSFFSARIYKCYKNKIRIELNDKVIVQGIPKGYVDKKGLRQNYIHVTEYNGISISKDIVNLFDIDVDELSLWNGKKHESISPTTEEQAEMEQLIREIIGDENE